MEIRPRTITAIFNRRGSRVNPILFDTPISAEYPA